MDPAFDEPVPIDRSRWRAVTAVVILLIALVPPVAFFLGAARDALFGGQRIVIDNRTDAAYVAWADTDLPPGVDEGLLPRHGFEVPPGTMVALPGSTRWEDVEIWTAGCRSLVSIPIDEQLTWRIAIDAGDTVTYASGDVDRASGARDAAPTEHCSLSSLYPDAYPSLPVPPGYKP